jgi:hypothetical protein
MAGSLNFKYGGIFEYGGTLNIKQGGLFEF